MCLNFIETIAMEILSKLFALVDNDTRKMSIVYVCN